MAKNKAPSLPSTPTFQVDPIAKGAAESLYGLGQNATSFQNIPGMLRETLDLSPDITRLMLQGLQAQLAGPLRQQRQDTVNTLEANNQLTGSTTVSALGNIDENYTNQLVSAGSNAGIADINRALSNRVALYGTGLNAVQSAGQLGASNQGQINSFNLENYQNQVAKVLAEQKQKSGGLMGALTGGLGGALGGAVFGPAGMIAGGALGAAGGAFGPSGTGGGFLQSGAGLLGSLGLPGQQRTSYAGSTASNNPFGGGLTNPFGSSGSIFGSLGF